MCGIAGFAGPFDPDRLRAMVGDLHHRGPDASGFLIEEGIGLGHARLSILDHGGGQQPMYTTDNRLAVVYNGEIYNHRELRTQLQQLGHSFVSDHSDTEVLLHGFREWGPGLCSRLNGMWAFAVLDREKRRLFVSRDRFGQKPLYYSFLGGHFVFCSELTPIVSHAVQAPSLSIIGIQKYFAYGFIPAPGSLYEGICKLPAGHNLTVSLGDLSHTRTCYWNYVPDPEAGWSPRREAAWADALREHINRAVSRRLEADVPLGVFLSGGIDSSSVTAFASTAPSQVEKLRTFSIGFQEESFDETPYFDRVATLFSTDHHAATVSQATIRDRWQAIASTLDEPMGDSSYLPTFILCEETRRHVTVALGGDGADELFAGYDPFRALKWAELYQKCVPRLLHQGLRLAAAHMPVSCRNMSLDFRIRKTLQGLEHPPRLWNPVWLSPMDPADIAELLSMPVEPEELYSEAVACWDGCSAESAVDRTIQFYIKLYLQDDILTKVDRASMRHSLEVRSPYLDIELVDFVRRLPWQCKFRNGATKVLLKKALEPVLPHDIIYRPKKGFGVPLAQWFRSWPFDIAHLPAILDKDMVQQRIEAHRDQKINDRLFLWNTVLLNTYCRTNSPAGKQALEDRV